MPKAPIDAANGRQSAQKDLVALGEQIPGVAEALAVYAAVSPYLPAPKMPVSQVKYATGGNS
jgi:hypothetical protein